jgi:hypothetical protein
MTCSKGLAETLTKAMWRQRPPRFDIDAIVAASMKAADAPLKVEDDDAKSGLNAAS